MNFRLMFFDGFFVIALVIIFYGIQHDLIILIEEKEIGK